LHNILDSLWKYSLVIRIDNLRMTPNEARLFSLFESWLNLGTWEKASC
jgi:hypothetical protein